MLDPKVVFLGDMSVGKSSILCRLSRGEWEPDIFTTIGTAFINHTFTVNGQPCKLCLWDTPGQDAYASQSTLCVRDASACIVVYDVTRQITYDHVDDHVSRYIANCQLKKPFVVIVGNKSDLLNFEGSAQQLDLISAKEQDPCLRTFLVSAKSGEQVQELFQFVAQEVLQRYNPADRPGARDEILDLAGTNWTEPGKTKGCC